MAIVACRLDSAAMIELTASCMLPLPFKPLIMAVSPDRIVETVSLTESVTKSPKDFAVADVNEIRSVDREVSREIEEIEGIASIFWVLIGDGYFRRSMVRLSIALACSTMLTLAS